MAIWNCPSPSHLHKLLFEPRYKLPVNLALLWLCVKPLEEMRALAEKGWGASGTETTHTHTLAQQQASVSGLNEKRQYKSSNYHRAFKHTVQSCNLHIPHSSVSFCLLYYNSPRPSPPFLVSPSLLLFFSAFSQSLGWATEGLSSRVYGGGYPYPSPEGAAAQGRRGLHLSGG